LRNRAPRRPSMKAPPTKSVGAGERSAPRCDHVSHARGPDIEREAIDLARGGGDVAFRRATALSPRSLSPVVLSASATRHSSSAARALPYRAPT
jgi:hypothetical protein